MVRDQLYFHVFNVLNSNEVCADFKFSSAAAESDKTFNFNADQAVDSTSHSRKSHARSPEMSQIKLPEIPPAKWEEVNL